MNRRRAKYLLPCCILLCGWAARPASPVQQSSAPPQDSTAARFFFGGNAAQIPAVFLRNLIFLPARINAGKPFLFELDTAAEKSAAGRNQAGASSGDALPYAVLTLPGVQIPFVTLPVASPDDFAPQVGQVYQGTLGKDFLDRVIVQVDYVRETVQLYDPAVFTDSGEGKSFPLTFDGSLPLIRAKFEVSGHKSLQADFVLDTALDAGILFYREFTDSERISAAHFKTEAASYPEVDGGAKLLLGRLKSFQIGAYGLEDVVAAFSQQARQNGAGKKVAGAIGSDFLRRFSIVFDFPHQRVILTPNSNFNHDADQDMSGLSIIAKGSNLRVFEVVAVQPDSPGGKAGLQPGDVIAGVDDEAAADLSLSAVRDLFRQIGHQYKLLVERKGQTFTVPLQMRRRI
ncbi:MAG: PDZ domain-containing protein [Candidatus Acidiferrales bacterium]